MLIRNRNTVLVTGATGFIGAHIVDTLLLRGLTVRGATRSPAKGQAMIKARSQHDSRLSFVQIQDFESPGGMKEAVEGVDAIIHTASVRQPPNDPLHVVLTLIPAVYIQHHEQRARTCQTSDQRCASRPGSGKCFPHGQTYRNHLIVRLCSRCHPCSTPILYLYW